MFIIFKDFAKADSKFGDDLQLMYNAGIMIDSGNGLLKPASTLTRAEMDTLVVKILKYLKQID